MNIDLLLAKGNPSDCFTAGTDRIPICAATESRRRQVTSSMRQPGLLESALRGRLAIPLLALAPTLCRRMRSAKAKAASCPHRHWQPFGLRQRWALLGASMPCRRMRSPWISSVSPSTTEATPARVSARARLGSSAKNTGRNRMRGALPIEPTRRLQALSSESGAQVAIRNGHSRREVCYMTDYIGGQGQNRTADTGIFSSLYCATLIHFIYEFSCL